MVQRDFPARQLIVPQDAGLVAEPPRLSRVSWAGVYLLLAVAMVLIGGYEFGVGNQGIQVPLLERAIDPQLFSNDAMVTGTAADYPTYFFRLLATPAKWIGVQRLYLLLHVLTAWAVVAVVVWLAAAMFRSRAVGLITAGMLMAGHLHALGGDGLYSTGFTHTYAVFPMALASIALAFRRRYFAATLLAGLTFNLHALTAAYTVVFVAAMWIAERPTDWRRWWQPPVMLVLFAAMAFPTLREMATHRQVFDQQWVGLTHVRSADHSFPSVWWQSGSSDVPRFALLAGIFALSLASAARQRIRRQTLGLVAAAAGLFLVGYLLADVWPVPSVLRAQLFRCSRLVMVVMFVWTAYSLVRAWQTRNWLHLVASAFAVLAISIPSLLPLLPLAFAGMVLAAVIGGRLSIPIAVAAGLVLFIAVAAQRDLGFRLIAKPQPIAALPFGLIAVVYAVLLVVLARLMSRREQLMIVPVTIAAAVSLMVLGQHDSTTAWDDVQTWARGNTAKDAVFLTPTQPGGFRLLSQRAVVGEWRDGTQLYFSSKFGPQWWGRMLDLQPGLITDASGRNVLSFGKPLAALGDEAIAAIAGKYGATHVVLPRKADRQLPAVYENGAYGVYLAQLPPAEPPAEATDKDKWQADEKFMREVVLPNIEKNRKSDAKLQVVDAAGIAVAGATVEVKQVNSAFHFSASLPFFQQPAANAANKDFMPPPVEQAELDRFKEVFNASMIPFSGKWMYVEPVEGERHYQDLDKYVAWCQANNVRMEFHFLSGYFADWVKKKPPAQQGEAFLRHAKQMAERYGDKIQYWQVVNETILMQQSPAVFKMMREVLPNAQLGISDCAKFAPETRSRRRTDVRQDMIRGLAEVKWLKEQGVKLDFFGFHGHRPFGVWPEASQMYASLDEFAREGVKVHITEFTVPQDTAVISPIRGGTFTPDVQAQFYERFFTICYSHPTVDLINVWGIGPHTWQKGSGLLDDQYNPKPAYLAIKKLITETWRTNATLKTGIGGLTSFRGFHGDYVATVKTPDGKSRDVRFTIQPISQPDVVRLQLQ